MENDQQNVAVHHPVSSRAQTLSIVVTVNNDKSASVTIDQSCIATLPPSWRRSGTVHSIVEKALRQWLASAGLLVLLAGCAGGTAGDPPLDPRLGAACMVNSDCRIPGWEDCQGQSGVTPGRCSLPCYPAGGLPDNVTLCDSLGGYCDPARGQHCYPVGQ